jgi:hypothetical protein
MCAVLLVDFLVKKRYALVKASNLVSAGISLKRMLRKEISFLGK